MKKHIKVQATVLPGFTKVLFRVLEQDYTGAAFGDGSNKFYASNGIVLGSNNYPARDKDDTNVIWLRGANRDKNNNAVCVTAGKWKKIAAAIAEYNAYEFLVRRAAAPAPRPAAEPCSVIIG